MPYEPMINHEVVHKDDRPSYKQKKFYRILSGRVAPKDVTRDELNNMIQNFSDDKVAKARATFKGMKRATRFQYGVMRILGVRAATDGNRVSRSDAAKTIASHTTDERRRAVRQWRAEQKAAAAPLI